MKLVLPRRLPRVGPRAGLTLVCALVGLLTAGAVAAWIEARLNTVVLAQVAARAQDHVQLGIASNVKSADFEVPHSLEKLADLAARLDPLLDRARQPDSGIIRFNLYARDGTILYSNVPGLRGQTVSLIANELLARALAGTPGAAISSLPGQDDSDPAPRSSRALEACIPLILDDRVVGVYELDEDPATIEPIRPLVWGSVALGSAVVYAGLFLAVVFTAPDRLRPRPLAAGTGESGRGDGPPPRQEWFLTRRELEVLRLMADDLTYPQIAARLMVDEETVRSHAKSVLRKLGQSSRANAILAARRAGII